jgi:hypothetical protein
MVTFTQMYGHWPLLRSIPHWEGLAIRAADAIDPEVVAAALPGARIRVLAGQAHMAHLIDLQSFTEAVMSFLHGSEAEAHLM